MGGQISKPISFFLTDFFLDSSRADQWGHFFFWFVLETSGFSLHPGWLNFLGPGWLVEVEVEASFLKGDIRSE